MGGTTAEEMLKRELTLELGGESVGSSMRMLNYVNMGLWGFSMSDFRQSKDIPSQTPPPSPPPSLGGSYFSVLNRTQPKPISMAKLIMSRHGQRKSPQRPRTLRPQPPPTTSLRHESRPMSSWLSRTLITYSPNAFPSNPTPHCMLTNRCQHIRQPITKIYLSPHLDFHILAHHLCPLNHHLMHSRIFLSKLSDYPFIFRCPLTFISSIYRL